MTMHHDCSHQISLKFTNLQETGKMFKFNFLNSLSITILKLLQSTCFYINGAIFYIFFISNNHHKVSICIKFLCNYHRMLKKEFGWWNLHNMKINKIWIAKHNALVNGKVSSFGAWYEQFWSFLTWLGGHLYCWILTL